MKIFSQIAPLRAFLKGHRQHDSTVGLVPTMGALHSGHRSLLDVSKKENKITVCSIFVNPAQFNNPNDLALYPRTLDKDTALLENVGCDALFLPPVEEMYPEKPAISFDFGALDKVMEGQFRPGHFSGVALVVGKLFNIVQPDIAYFGQKDWQQFAIIRRLKEQMNFDLQLRAVPTLREPDGLALSSRNLRLNNEERKQAVVFYESLRHAQQSLREGQPLQTVKEIVVRAIAKQSLVKLEYFELADSENLNILNSVDEGNRPILCVAGYVGEVRLIDNMFLDLS